MLLALRGFSYSRAMNPHRADEGLTQNIEKLSHYLNQMDNTTTL